LKSGNEKFGGETRKENPLVDKHNIPQNKTGDRVHRDRGNRGKGNNKGKDNNLGMDIHNRDKGYNTGRNQDYCSKFERTEGLRIQKNKRNYLDTHRCNDSTLPQLLLQTKLLKKEN
jgi:hypothetical protein